jgi:hypothetical protein
MVPSSLSVVTNPFAFVRTKATAIAPSNTFTVIVAIVAVAGIFVLYAAWIISRNTAVMITSMFSGVTNPCAIVWTTASACEPSNTSTVVFAVVAVAKSDEDVVVVVVVVVVDNFVLRLRVHHLRVSGRGGSLEVSVKGGGGLEIL